MSTHFILRRFCNIVTSKIVRPIASLAIGSLSDHPEYIVPRTSWEVSALEGCVRDSHRLEIGPLILYT